MPLIGLPVSYLPGITAEQSTTHTAGRGSHSILSVELVQAPVRDRFEQIEQVGLQPHEQRLGLRVAEAAVELQHPLGPGWSS